MRERHEADMRLKAATRSRRPAAGDLPRRLQDDPDESGWACGVRRWGASSALEPGKWSRSHAPCQFGTQVPGGTRPGELGHRPRSERKVGVNEAARAAKVADQGKKAVLLDRT